MSEGRLWPQLIAAFGATFGSFGCGTVLSWTAPALPHMEISACNGSQTGCDIELTTAEASLVGSIMAIGGLSAGPIAGAAMSYYGRRTTMILMAPIGVLGWALLVFASNPAMLYSGRFFTGFSSCSYASLSTTYTSEIADSRVRGALAGIMQTMCMAGVLFVYVLGKWLTWSQISIVCGAVPILTSVWMFFMPESPVFLVEKGRMKEARDKLKWLRGPDADIDKELEIITEKVEESRRVGSVGFVTLFTNKVYIYPLIIGIVIMFLQQWSGINAVTFYAVQILTDTGSSMADDGSIYLGIVNVGGTILSVLLVDRLGRKPLLIFSGLFMTIFISGLAAFFLLQEDLRGVCIERDVNVTSNFTELLPNCTNTLGPMEITRDTIHDLAWLPLTCLLVYIFVFAVGFGPIAWTLNSELYPREARSLAGSIGYSANWLNAFLVTLLEPILEEALSRSFVFFLFGGLMLGGAIFVIIFLPETNGKSPEDMKEYFLRKKTIK